MFKCSKRLKNLSTFCLVLDGLITQTSPDSYLTLSEAIPHSISIRRTSCQWSALVKRSFLTSSPYNGLSSSAVFFFKSSSLVGLSSVRWTILNREKKELSSLEIRSPKNSFVHFEKAASLPPSLSCSSHRHRSRRGRAPNWSSLLWSFFDVKLNLG